MIAIGEIWFALYGFGRLLKFDPGFLACFDLSPEGARRSFRLAWLLAPIGILFLLHDLEPPPGRTLATGWEVWIAAILYYAMVWIIFPLFLLLASPAFGRRAEAPGAIVIYNWLGALVLLLYGLFDLIGRFGLDTSLAFVILYWVNFPIEGFAFRHALRLPVFSSIMLVLADFVIGRLLWLIFGSLIFR